MTTAHEAQRLLVHRHYLRNTCISADVDTHAPLAHGRARMRVDSFALTASNVTYAVFGEAMKYWEFFPTDNPSFGCIPVWGFATVVESRVEGLAIGERCFGFWPMGSHAVVQPTHVDGRGFVDGSAHRQTLPRAYNRVQFCRADPAYLPSHEARQALMRPLFITSFLIDDFLAENDFFGARQVLLSSASSKTAYGTALCLMSRSGSAGFAAFPDSAGELAVTGLTAQANLRFTRSLGCYHEVHAYDDLSALDPQVPTVYIDMSGSEVQRLAVHAHFNGALSYSCAVGGAQWDALGHGGGLTGPRPTLFFAPTQLKKRSSPPAEGWEAERLAQRVQAAWTRLMAAMDGAGTVPWLQVHEGHGVEAVRQAYLALIEGRADPRAGHMLSLWPLATQA
jgi:hypothetical protein